MKPHVEIYTDGACSPNPGTGGWGAVLISREHDHRRELSGAEADSTNNRMELNAAIRALEALKQPCRVDLYTDSTYLKNAFEQGWLANWQRKRWKTKGGKSVANQDLWKALLTLDRRHEVKWRWVKGHAGHPENDRADELAVAARMQLQDSTTA
ncbi:MAG TPA: ribonuclease HI [Deltaproteobacteria bacterium]|nr:ribonuclease HI [Deltaproteobacteria bacterium]